MANAKPRDSRAGFAIYLQSSDGIQLDQMNAKLKRAGYGPIKQRTLTHYRNLVKAGFNRYISINRFDVARASRAYENLSSLARYRYRATDQNAHMTFAKNTRIIEVNGRMIEAGDVGAVVSFTEEEEIELLRSLAPRSGDPVSLRIQEATHLIYGAVVDIDLASLPIVAEVEYGRLVSLDALVADTALPAMPFLLRVLASDDDSPTIDVVGRRLHHVFDLLEGLRAVLNEVGRHCDSPLYAAPPIVDEMRLSSPATLLLQMPPELLYLMSWPIIGGGLYLLPKAVEMRKTWHEGTMIKRTGKKQSYGLDLENQLKEIEVRTRESEEKLRQEILDRVRQQIRESNITDSHLREIIDAYVVPAFRAIRQSDIREIDIADIASKNPDNENAGDGSSE